MTSQGDQPAIEVSAELRTWLDGLVCVVGSIVHTFDGPLDVDAVKTDDGWVCTKAPASPDHTPERSSAMITYNGYAPNESHTCKVRPKKVEWDTGHSIVSHTTSRPGDAFWFRYAVTCQCGKRYTGQTFDRAWRGHAAHAKKVQQVPTTV